jgi:hypothetical protein
MKITAEITKVETTGDQLVAIPRRILDAWFDLVAFIQDFAEGNPEGPFAHG